MKILKCRDCGRYTMEEACPVCGGGTGSPEPARFSPEDRYGEYRRDLKREQLED